MVVFEEIFQETPEKVDQRLSFEGDEDVENVEWQKKKLIAEMALLPDVTYEDRLINIAKGMFFNFNF